MSATKATDLFDRNLALLVEIGVRLYRWLKPISNFPVPSSELTTLYVDCLLKQQQKIYFEFPCTVFGTSTIWWVDTVVESFRFSTWR